ncbi:MAG: hypothetical protein MUE46_17710 [Xanthomonadales bacterium]|jgi:hypothetical protein|nr:hypothetical protein [Xanthomonadales bacterium]
MRVHLSKIGVIALALSALVGFEVRAAAAAEAAGSVPPAVAADPTETLYRGLIERHAGALATIEYVMTADYSGTPQRVQGETEGVVISRDGYLLVAGSALDPAKPYEVMYRDMGMESTLPRVSSGEFQVRLPGRSERYEAKLVSRDADLGLAWLQLTAPPADLPWVDLAKGSAPRLGQRGLVLSLASEQYDFAPYVTEVRLQGEIQVPYKAMIVTWPNKLVFNTDLQPIGFGVLNLAGRPGMLASGGMKSFAVLIPNERLVELTARVRAAQERTTVEGR